ncbi:MAG: hypothetical protein ACKV2V_02460 [Blastocatellia bacterium]
MPAAHLNLASPDNNLASGSNNPVSCSNNPVSAPNNPVSPPNNFVSAPNNLVSPLNNLVSALNNLVSAPNNLVSAPNNLVSACLTCRFGMIPCAIALNNCETGQLTCRFLSLPDASGLGTRRLRPAAWRPRPLLETKPLQPEQHTNGPVFPRMILYDRCAHFRPLCPIPEKDTLLCRETPTLPGVYPIPPARP